MLNLWANIRRALPLLALLLGTQACFDEKDLDFDRLAGLKISPSVAIPLVHGSLAIEDVLTTGESAYIHYGEDQLVHVLYSDTIYSTSIRDLFLLPQLQLNKYYPAYSNATGNSNNQIAVQAHEELDLGFSEARFDEITLSQGKLLISSNSNINADVDLLVSLPTLKKDGQPLSVSLRLPAGNNGNQTTERDLQNFEADLTDYGTGNNIIPVEIQAIVNSNDPAILLNLANYLQLDLNITELNFSLLTGYLGQPEVQLPTNQIPLTIFETVFSKAEFSIKEPILSFDLLNGSGVPVTVKTDLLQARSKDGSTLPIATSPGSPFNVNYPTQVEETALTRLTITNAGEALGMAPAFIDYRLSGRLNVGTTENLNFLTGNSSMAAIVHADIPLWGSLTGLSLTDTLDFTLQAEDAYVKEAIIRANVTNSFPIGVDLQVYFLDEDLHILDSLFDSSSPQLIRASQVNSLGELSSPGELSQDINISSARFERILKSDKIVVKGLFYTSRAADGTLPDVRIKSNHRLSVNLGVKTDMNISVKL